MTQRLRDLIEHTPVVVRRARVTRRLQDADDEALAALDMDSLIRIRQALMAVIEQEASPPTRG